MPFIWLTDLSTIGVTLSQIEYQARVLYLNPHCTCNCCFREINDAYEVLGNNHKKLAYDQSLKFAFKHPDDPFGVHPKYSNDRYWEARMAQRRYQEWQAGKRPGSYYPFGPEDPVKDEPEKKRRDPGQGWAHFRYSEQRRYPYNSQARSGFDFYRDFANGSRPVEPTYRKRGRLRPVHVFLIFVLVQLIMLDVIQSVTPQPGMFDDRNRLTDKEKYSR